MRVLNLYCGIGGNRKLWTNVQVTGVEIDRLTAIAYKILNQEDEFVIGDAHQYLLDHYQEYDFIWSSPPCVSHSRLRQHALVGSGRQPAIYPDLRLYEEIIFLQHNFDGYWIVENVDPYYEPLIPYTAKLGRHCFWTNIDLGDEVYYPKLRREISRMQLKTLQSYLGIDLTGISLKDKINALRNCVEPELGSFLIRKIDEKFGIV